MKVEQGRCGSVRKSRNSDGRIAPPLPWEREPLSHGLQVFYDKIMEHFDRHGKFPSFDHIAKFSTSRYTGRDMLTQLVNRGWLSETEKGRSMFYPTSQPSGYCDEDQDLLNIRLENLASECSILQNSRRRRRGTY